MSKCGIIMRDPQTEEPKIKLYKDKEGNLKGDGLCCYLKVSSTLSVFRGDVPDVYFYRDTNVFPLLPWCQFVMF